MGSYLRVSVWWFSCVLAFACLEVWEKISSQQISNYQSWMIEKGSTLK